MSTIKVDTLATRTGSGNITASNTIAGTSATLSGTLAVTGDATFDTDTLKVDSSNNLVGIGTTSPNRKLVVSGAGAEMSLANTNMSVDRRNMNWFMTGDKAHWRILNDAGNAGGVSVNIDNDGVLDATAFTGTYGTSFGILGSTAIGDSNIPYNSWGTPNSTYYRWVLPKAGTYLLSSNMRIRFWGVTGYIKGRLYNNTTSAAIEGVNLTGTTLGAQDHIRMLFEQANNATQINVNITANYMITTAADNQDIHHQLWSTDNSSNTSMQSDINGRNIHYWQRIG